MKTFKNRNSKKNAAIVITAIVILLTAVYSAYAYINNSWPFLQQSRSEKNEQSINFDPPTSKEIESSQDGKKNSADPKPANKSDGTQSVSVQISYAEKAGTNLDVRAFTSDVIEENGECTATLTSGAIVIKRTSNGFIDAASTICEPIKIPLTEIDSEKNWTLVVSYNSPDSRGSSPAKGISL